MDKKALGKRIQAERKKLNLTQEKLAEDVDITTSYIGQIETGRKGVTLDKLTDIAKRLGVTIDYLLSDSLPIQEGKMTDIWNQLTSDKSEKEKELAINLVKMVFTYLEDNTKPEHRR